jgi:prephenate dehydratase
MLPKETTRVSLLMELDDGVGVLHNILRYFWKHDVNVCRIESRPAKGGKFDFFVDFDGQRGEENVEKLLADILPMTEKLLILDEKEVRQLSLFELTAIAQGTNTQIVRYIHR